MWCERRVIAVIDQLLQHRVVVQTSPLGHGALFMILMSMSLMTMRPPAHMLLKTLKTS